VEKGPRGRCVRQYYYRIPWWGHYAVTVRVKASCDDTERCMTYGARESASAYRARDTVRVLIHLFHKLFSTGGSIFFKRDRRFGRYCCCRGCCYCYKYKYCAIDVQLLK